MSAVFHSLSAGLAVLFLTIGILFSLACAVYVLKLVFERFFNSRTVDVPVEVMLQQGPVPMQPRPEHPNGPMSPEDEAKLTPTEVIEALQRNPAAFPEDDLPKALPTPYTLQGDAIVRAPGEFGGQVFLKQGRTVYIVPPGEADPEIMAARRAALGLVEVIGVQCADGGKCHHGCTEKCARKDGCVPLSAAKWLNDDWSLRK